LILDTTHIRKDQKQIINDLVGKPFSFLEAIKLGGIGSKRMIIGDISPNLESYFNSFQDIKYANIELRSGGILVHFDKGLTKFVWVIPFYHLVIYKTNGLSIHAQGKYIRFKTVNMFSKYKTFLNKLLDQKIKSELKYDFLHL